MTGWFDRFRDFLSRTCGVTLDADKAYFVESRLLSLAQQHGFGSAEDLFSRYERTRDKLLERDIVQAMLTNETFFFRDRIPFDHFRNVILPHLVEARAQQRQIRIWCAAASTGQEPYSLAMILDEEARKLVGWRVEIVATDLSDHALDLARAGVYTQFEVQRGLPVNQLLRYFQREGDRWRIVEHLRARVQFRRFNLLEDFQSLGAFDVVFCRNVLIYFDLGMRRKILGKLAGSIAPDGYLALGATESVVGVCDSFEPHPKHQSICSKREAAVAPGAPVPAGRPVLKVIAGG